MKHTIVKIGSLTQDTATGLKGMVTHFSIGLAHAPLYLFQPYGINPDTGHPVKGLWLAESRLVNPEHETVDLPTEVLGTEVKDRASGLSGVAIGVTRHTNGCIHIDIQPKGTLKNGDPIASYEVDIRRLEGPAIRRMTEAERKADEEKHPSPALTPTRPRV